MSSLTQEVSKYGHLRGKLEEPVSSSVLVGAGAPQRFPALSSHIVIYKVNCPIRLTVQGLILQKLGVGGLIPRASLP